jgi:hypothetical protein
VGARASAIGIVGRMTLLLVGGLVAGIAAALVVRPLWERRDRTVLAGIVATTAAIVLLGPTLAIEVSETLRFVRLELADAGVPRNVDPPLSEQLVDAVRQELAAGERWAVVTPTGYCQEDELAYQWLAFRLHPAPPGCAAPDVTVYAGVRPPGDAVVVRQVTDGAVAR